MTYAYQTNGGQKAPTNAPLLDQTGIQSRDVRIFGVGQNSSALPTGCNRLNESSIG
jgi:hypothetical protein